MLHRWNMYWVASTLDGAWGGEVPSGLGRPGHSCPRSSIRHFSTKVPSSQSVHASQRVVAETKVGSGPVWQLFKRPQVSAASSKSPLQTPSEEPQKEIHESAVDGAHASNEPPVTMLPCAHNQSVRERSRSHT